MDTGKGNLIVIESQKDLESLLSWRDNNKDLVRSFRPMMRAGIIEYVSDEAYRQEFRFLSDILVQHEYLAGGILKGFGFTYNLETWQVTNIKGTISFYPTDLAIQDMITVHSSIMAVMEHVPEYIRLEDGVIKVKVSNGRGDIG